MFLEDTVGSSDITCSVRFELATNVLANSSSDGFNIEPLYVVSKGNERYEEFLKCLAKVQNLQIFLKQNGVLFLII